MGGKRPTICIIDNAKVSRMVVKQSLAGGGYRFLEAENGQEALSIIDTYPVELVTTDLALPVVDGFPVLEQLKADLPHATIPVIAHSVSKDTRSIRKALPRVVMTI